MVGGLRALLFRRPTPITSNAPGSTDRAYKVVLAGWAVLSVALLGYVVRYVRNTPTSDEWDFVANLTGERPAWPWVWAPHNEHRYPLARMIWLGLHRLTGFDFRPGAILSVLLVAGASLALVRAARSVRGRSHLADLLVPALLLHFGHWENWLTGYQLAFTLPIAAVGLALAVIATEGDRLTARHASLIGAACVVLVLSGGAGILLGVPLAGWAMLVAVRDRRWVRLILPLAAVGYTAVVMAPGRPVGPPISASWADKASTALELLAGGAGIAGRDTWPVSGFLAGSVMVGAIAGLAWVATRRERADRYAALGLLAIIAGVCAIAGAIAVSRTGLFPQVGFSPRYALFPAVGLIAAYLAAIRFYGLLNVRLLGPAGAILAAVLVAASAPEGVAYGKVFSFVDLRCRLHAREGLSPEQIAAEDTALAFSADGPDHRRRFQEALSVLSRHQLGPYRP